MNLLNLTTRRQIEQLAPLLQGVGRGTQLTPMPFLISEFLLKSAIRLLLVDLNRRVLVAKYTHNMPLPVTPFLECDEPVNRRAATGSAL